MNHSKVFTKGMNMDLHPKFQEDGTYPFALNAVLETIDGEVASITNESGTIKCAANFPENKKIIGSALTETEELILFLYSPAGEHEIGRYNPNKCLYETILQAECLNFSDKHPINALYKLKSGCTPYVYFTDGGYNPYRVINLEDLDQYKISGVHYCPKMDYARDYFQPCLFLYQGISNTGIVENAGGEVEIGVHYFAVRFLDKYKNATPWTIYSRPVAIADEPYSYTQDNATVGSYDGGSNNPESEFYVGKTNKAISILINGTQDLFDYYQVAVIKRTGDGGEISGVDLCVPSPWIDGSAAFVYKGTEDQIEQSISLNEVLTANARIKNAEAQAIEANKLYIANTSGSYRDYTKYQQYASKIKTEFVKSAITDDKSARVKQGIYYFQDGSFMENEAYGFGIVYVFSDGTDSPVFWTVGRAANTDIPVNANNPYIGTGGVTTDGKDWDTGLTLYGDPIAGTQRWQQISTAMQYGTTLAGLPGYYQADGTYPDIPTCTELPDGYWGRDWHGNLIVPGVTPIRHHRMPGPEIRDSGNNAVGFRTGVRFSNVEYPAGEDIVGHYFVYTDRTFDRTILAKGAFIPLDISGPDHTIDPTTISAQTYNPTPPPNTGITANVYAFIGSDLLLKDKVYKGTYVKFEKIYRDLNQEADDTSISNNVVTTDYTFSVPDKYIGDLDSTTEFRYFSKYTLPTSSNLIHTFRTDLKVQKSYEGAQEGTQAYEPLSNVTFTNNSINTTHHIIKLNSGSSDIAAVSGAWRGKLYYGAIMQSKAVFSNLFEAKFKKMSNCISREGTLSTQYTFYGGDTATSRLTMTDFSYTQTGVPQEDTNSFTFDVDSYVLSFPTQDTYLNYEFRHGSKSDVLKQYYQLKNPNIFSANHNLQRKYIQRKIRKTGDKAFGVYPETYNYNDCFSYLDGLVYHYPIQFAYPYCNTCIEEYPYRIWASETDDNESIQDRFRVVKVNNYTDQIGGETGEITDLFVNYGKLYATTPKALYHVPTRPQTLQTDVDNIFLGTGQTFSIPPIPLGNLGNAFAGQQKFTSRISTEYGTFFVDSLSGYPVLLSSDIKDLSLNGLRSYWQNNGELQFLKQFERLSGEVFPYISHASPIGVGYKTGYDPRYKRLIIHKRDYTILPQWEPKFVYNPTETDNALLYTDLDKLWFNGHSFYYNDLSGFQYSVEFDSAYFFENKSFTLSYFVPRGSWASFHSYLPTYLGNTSNDIVAQKDYSEPYKFSQENYQTYFGVKYPHIVDVILSQNPQQAAITSSISLSARATEKDYSTNSYKNAPSVYTSAIFYNSKQSSGEVPLKVLAPFDLDSANSATLIRSTENQWRVNNIRDIVIDPYAPIWDSSWTGKLGGASLFSYIDKVPYIPNLGGTKTSFEKGRFRDYYFGARLIAKDTKDIKLTLDLVSTQDQNSNK